MSKVRHFFVACRAFIYNVYAVWAACLPRARLSLPIFVPTFNVARFNKTTHCFFGTCCPELPPTMISCLLYILARVVLIVRPIRLRVESQTSGAGPWYGT